MKSEQIIEKLTDNMSVFRKFGIIRIGLFGSGARNEITDTSDLDILIEFSPGKKSFDNYMDAKIFLEDLFLLKIDLVIMENIKPILKENILKEVIYAA
ncbi:MAG: nucleotidyltransferase family protein [Leptospirales bacterium]